AEQLLRRGAVWNTFVCVAQATTLWEMTRQAAPDLYRDFMAVRQALGSPRAACITEYLYRTLRAVNFSSGVCEALPSRLRVLPAPAVGWSDWGSVERICDALRQRGKMNDAVQRALAAVRASQRVEECPYPLVGRTAPSLGLVRVGESS
ncbi:MAG: hypothetical protein AB7P69_26090, partial [Candidatus Binatia bacterium]